MNCPRDEEFQVVHCCSRFEEQYEQILQLISTSKSKYISYLHSPSVLISQLNEAKDAKLILVFKSGQLSCLLPLVGYDYFPLSFSILPSLRIRAGIWRVLGSHPILQDDRDIEVLSLVLNEIIDGDSRQALFVELLYSDSPFAQSMKKLEKKGRYIPCFARKEKSHSLVLPESLESFLNSFRKKRRYNLNRSVKNISKQGNVVAREFKSEVEAEYFVKFACEVQKASWQGTTIGGTIRYDKSTVSQYQLIARSKILRCFLLQIDDKPIAFIRGYQQSGCYFYEEIGYDPAWAEYSPGTVLNWLMFPFLYEHDCPQRIEFGLGDAQYKKVFGNRVVEASRGIFAKRSGGLMILALFQALLLKLEAAIRYLLKKSNLETLVRGYLKGRRA